MFEHPWSSDVWNDAEIIPLRRKYGVRRVDMCAYGLRCPDTEFAHPQSNRSHPVMSSCWVFARVVLSIG